MSADSPWLLLIARHQGRDAPRQRPGRVAAEVECARAEIAAWRHRLEVLRACHHGHRKSSGVTWLLAVGCGPFHARDTSFPGTRFNDCRSRRRVSCRGVLLARQRRPRLHPCFPTIRHPTGFRTNAAPRTAVVPFVPCARLLDRRTATGYDQSHRRPAFATIRAILPNPNCVRYY